MHTRVRGRLKQPIKPRSHYVPFTDSSKITHCISTIFLIGAFPGLFWGLFFIFLGTLLDYSWWILQWYIIIGNRKEEGKLCLVLLHVRKRPTPSEKREQLWTKKSPSLSQDSNPASSNIMSLLYHLSHHHGPRQSLEIKMALNSGSPNISI